MREVLPIIWLMEEARKQEIPVLNATPKIHCNVFEDNAGAIEIANVPKMRPRTKHLTIKYHHFREEVKKGTISIYHTRTEEQIADIFTKPLPEQPFMRNLQHYYIEMRECEHTAHSALGGTLQGVSRRSPGRSRPQEPGRYGRTRQRYRRTR
jgi:hypothetical protein